jgi:hypothetical protein
MLLLTLCFENSANSNGTMTMLSSRSTLMLLSLLHCTILWHASHTQILFMHAMVAYCSSLCTCSLSTTIQHFHRSLYGACDDAINTHDIWYLQFLSLCLYCLIDSIRFFCNPSRRSQTSYHENYTSDLGEGALSIVFMNHVR